MPVNAGRIRVDEGLCIWRSGKLVRRENASGDGENAISKIWRCGRVQEEVWEKFRIKNSSTLTDVPPAVLR
jgi:hypothetical protein